MSNPESGHDARHLPGHILIGTAVALALTACSGGGDAAPAPRPSVSASVEQSGLPEAQPTGTVNLLAPEAHWQLAGVQRADAALQVSYVGRRIAGQDGSEGFENPAVNLYGTALRVQGDFSITADITDIHGEVGFSLYGKPPIVEDETRAELATVDTAIEGVSFWHQESMQPGGHLQEDEATITDNPAHQLTITVSGGQLTFAVDGQTVSQSPDNGMFADGHVYIGLDARQEGSSYTVRGLQAMGVNGGSVQAVDTRITPVHTGKGFKDLANKPLGSAVALGPMVADTGYQNILFSHFDQISIENALKAQNVHPQPDIYTFEEADAIVAMAKAHGITNIHGHAITFSEAQSGWLRDLEQSDPAAYRQAMIEHITAVVGHYKDTIQSWDINELLADYDEPTGELGLRDNELYGKVSYLVAYIKAIRQANPQAQIWLNDFGMESDGDRRGQMIALAKALKAKGAAVTGIGFQAHLDGSDVEDTPNSADRQAMIQEALDDVKAAGLKARIAELDREEDVPQQAIADVVSECMGHAACTGVTMWGVSDRYASSGDVDPDSGALTMYTGLCWDKELRPTKTVTYILAGLKATAGKS